MNTIITSIALFFNILLIDSTTKEPLVGVAIKTDKSTYYSDFSGSVDIPKGEKVLNISYISYSDVTKTFSCKSDTVIKMKTVQ